MSVITSHDWMLWNAFLALVPLGLAAVLFLALPRRVLVGLLCVAAVWSLLVASTVTMVWWRYGAVRMPLALNAGLTVAAVALLCDRLVAERPTRSPVWWLGAGLFVLFLPNSAYVITDLVHLVEDVDSGFYTGRAAVVGLVSLYAAFVLTGSEAYTLSLLALRSFLRRQGRGRLVPWVEISLHAACATGVYMGRFLRFNSWDVIRDPGAVATTTLQRLLLGDGVVSWAILFAILAVVYTVLKAVHLGIGSFWRERWVPPRTHAPATAPTPGGTRVPVPD